MSHPERHSQISNAVPVPESQSLDSAVSPARYTSISYLFWQEDLSGRSWGLAKLYALQSFDAAASASKYHYISMSLESESLRTITRPIRKLEECLVMSLADSEEILPGCHFERSIKDVDSVLLPTSSIFWASEIERSQILSSSHFYPPSQQPIFET